MDSDVDSCRVLRAELWSSRLLRDHSLVMQTCFITGTYKQLKLGNSVMHVNNMEYFVNMLIIAVVYGFFYFFFSFCHFSGKINQLFAK